MDGGPLLFTDASTTKRQIYSVKEEGEYRLETVHEWSHCSFRLSKNGITVLDSSSRYPPRLFSTGAILTDRGGNIYVVRADKTRKEYPISHQTVRAVDRNCQYLILSYNSTTTLLHIDSGFSVVLFKDINIARLQHMIFRNSGALAVVNEDDGTYAICCNHVLKTETKRPLSPSLLWLATQFGKPSCSHLKLFTFTLQQLPIDLRMKVVMRVYGITCPLTTNDLDFALEVVKGIYASQGRPLTLHDDPPVDYKKV